MAASSVGGAPQGRHCAVTYPVSPHVSTNLRECHGRQRVHICICLYVFELGGQRVRLRNARTECTDSLDETALIVRAAHIHGVQRTILLPMDNPNPGNDCK